MTTKLQKHDKQMTTKLQKKMPQKIPKKMTPQNRNDKKK